MKYLILTLLTISLAVASEALSAKTICYGNSHTCTGITTNEKSFNQHVNLAANKKHARGFAQQRKATGNRVFIFDPRRLMWAAYSAQGKLIKTGRASGGKGYCPDVRRSCRTPRGNFKIYSKGSSSCRSSKYPIGRGGAPMPYCMFFHRGYAIHGSPNVPSHNASHGCIRVKPAAAKWLHRNFIQHGTSVIVRPY